MLGDQSEEGTGTEQGNPQAPVLQAATPPQATPPVEKEPTGTTPAANPPAKGNESTRYFTQAEFSKMQSTLMQKNASLERRMELLGDALLEQRGGQAEPGAEDDEIAALLGDAPATEGRKKPKIEAYRKFIADEAKTREAEVTQSEAQRAVKEKIGEAHQMLKEAGVDPLDATVAPQFVKLIEAGNYAEIPTLAKRIAFDRLKKGTPNREQLEKEIERKIRAKYGLDQQDIGAGGGASGDISNLTAREKIDRGLADAAKKQTGGKR